MSKSAEDNRKILVLGAGNFGTCLAFHLAEMQHQVVMYARDAQQVQHINEQHKNIKYLPNYTLPNNLTATSVLDQELVHSCSVLLFSIPTQFLRSVLEQVKMYILESHVLIFANKGIEVSTLELPIDIIGSVLGDDVSDKAVFLSGPSFAVEILQKQPTAVTVASKSPERALEAQGVFHAPHFRVYRCSDPIGVEVAGALKNVVAIASGIATGMGFQMNTRAMLLTRGLSEITRVGVKLGANPLTFAGLAGMGDLMLTCSSEKSRNFTVGYRLGKGEKLDDIIKSLGSVAEGVTTAKAAYAVVKKLDVFVPILTEVYNILYENKPVQLALRDLMSVDAMHELDFISQ